MVNIIVLGFVNVAVGSSRAAADELGKIAHQSICIGINDLERFILYTLEIVMDVPKSTLKIHPADERLAPREQPR